MLRSLRLLYMMIVLAAPLDGPYRQQSGHWLVFIARLSGRGVPQNGGSAPRQWQGCQLATSSSTHLHIHILVLSTPITYLCNDDSMSVYETSFS